ncbi:MAG TPA: CofH family radical SAM protein [Phycisphaerae bacterium]|nr:CofH family radical SAM protein [Phycisphaerae bacterium]
MSTLTTDPDLADVAAKVESQTRLTHEDGLRLFATRDIHTLGELANRVRERLHGNNAYYNVNRHINYTNYCVLRCRFCSFYRPYPKSTARSATTATPRAATARAAGFSPRGLTPAPIIDHEHPDDAYELTVDQIVDRAAEAYDHGATEVHIVGGLHPKLPFDYYTDMCAAIRKRCPRMHVKAFTAIEIIHFSRIARPRLTVREVLTRLRDAGLDSLPGGGAEIFDDRVHDEAFKNKVGQTEWFEVHRTAHELGIFTNATMLYGHVETPAERVAHLIKLREHQDESLRSRPAHFNCVIPLSFIPEGSALADLPGPTGLDDLKTLAVSRLMLDNFPHVKAFWIMLSPKLAQVSLNWGVDDIDGTVVYYDITRREAHPDHVTHQELTVDDLKRLIHEAGRTPVERDSLYRPVIRDADTWRIESEPH